MHKTTAALVLAASLASSAVADPLDDPKPVKTTIERLTGQPAVMVTPAAPIDPNKVPSGWAPDMGRLPPAGAKPQKTVLNYEPGGRIDAHIERFRHVAENGGEVEIRGLCQSACTLILGHIPQERLCFGARASLNFHKASNPDGSVSMEYTGWMMGWYPRNIRDWIDARGGFEKMPHNRTCSPPNCFWTLPAAELFKMGYRKCPD